MAVADQPPFRPGVEFVALCRQTAPREALGGAQTALIKYLRARFTQRRQVLLQGRYERIDPGAVRCNDCRLGVEAGESAGDRGDVCGLELTSRRERGQASVYLHPPHLDCELDCSAMVLGGERVAIGTADDGDDSQVEPWGKAPVEAHLLQAHLMAPRDRSVVEEGENDGLLHLVDELAGEEYPRNVRFAELHRTRPVRVKSGSSIARTSCGSFPLPCGIAQRRRAYRPSQVRDRSGPQRSHRVRAPYFGRVPSQARSDPAFRDSLLSSSLVLRSWTEAKRSAGPGAVE